MRRLDVLHREGGIESLFQVELVKVNLCYIGSLSRELGERERLAARPAPLAGLARAGEPEALHALEVAVLSVAHQVLVECGDPLRPLGKSHSVARHGVPGRRTDRERGGGLR